MNSLFQDVRFGARMLLRRPTFTCIAVLTLALGIGANSAIFSIVNAVILNPLPFAEPDRLVKIYGNMHALGMTSMSASVPEFTDYCQQANSFEQIGAYDGFSANLTPAGADAERVEALAVTPELLAALKVAPQAGRIFFPEDAQDGRDTVVILSDDLWRRRFQANPGVVGQTVIINGRDHTVVGVMPPGFRFPLQTELWKPLWFPPEQYAQQARGSRGLIVIGRLRPETTLAGAQAEMDRLAEASVQQYPRNYESRGWKISIVPLIDDYVRDVRKGLLILLGAVSFVLLIACANVANLMLANATARKQEIAVRIALGATRWQIARQLLTESTLLGVCGGALGLGLVVWTVDLLLRFAPPNLPRLNEVHVNSRVLAFTLAVSILTGIVFGTVPALAASNPDLNQTLKDGGRGGSAGAKGHRLRSALVVAEITLTLVLLVGAGLMLKSFLRLQSVDPGFNPDGVLTMRMMLPYEVYEKPAQRSIFYQRVLEGLDSTPGVETASASSRLPLTQGGSSGTVSAENSAVGPGDLPVEADWCWVTPGYFKTIGVPLVNGRTFSDADTDGAPLVAVVDEAFARTFYPDQDAVGKRIKRGKLDSTRPWLTVVGVVKHIQARNLDATEGPQVYFPFYQDPSPFNMSIAVRTTAEEPLSLAGAVRATVQAVDRNQPVYSLATLRQIAGNSVAQRRFSMLLMAVFGSVALLLSAIGIYGVMSYAVTQRTHEIGIRMAIGAQEQHVLSMIVGQGMTLSAFGVIGGLAAALALTRTIKTLLFNVSATDPFTFTAIAVVLLVVSLLACLIPARRAARVDPMVALRTE